MYTKVLIAEAMGKQLGGLFTTEIFHFPANSKSETRVVAWLGSGKAHLLGYMNDILLYLCTLKRKASSLVSYKAMPFWRAPFYDVISS